MASLPLPLAAGGCLDRPLERVEPRITGVVHETLTQRSIDKIDLLLMIDNSRSMADKQQFLGLAVSDLLDRLVNPLCVNADGLPVSSQPALPLRAARSARKATTNRPTT